MGSYKSLSGRTGLLFERISCTSPSDREFL